VDTWRDLITPATVLHDKAASWGGSSRGRCSRNIARCKILSTGSARQSGPRLGHMACGSRDRLHGDDGPRYWRRSPLRSTGLGKSGTAKVTLTSQRLSSRVTRKFPTTSPASERTQSSRVEAKKSHDMGTNPRQRQIFARRG